MTTDSIERLAVDGGKPVRTRPLPLEFPGVHRIDDREIEAATRVLRSRSLFRYYGIDLQSEVESFEREFREFVGARHAIAVASGTGALHTALSALGVGPGQEIIIPAYLWVSVIAAVVNHGAIPVLADIDDTFCLNPEEVEKQVTSRTRGIIMVHMSGAPGNVIAVREVAKRRGLFLLEDCAQCAGGTVGGRKVGSFGDMAIFSFQMNKNMTAGEGGCVVTGDEELARRAVACHDLGYPREGGRLVMDRPGLQLWGRGYRLDELRAAVLRVQLGRLPGITAAMRRSKYRIRKALEAFPQLQLRRIIDPEGDTGCFLITTYPDSATARKVNTALRAEGIVTYPQGQSNIVMTEWGLHLYYNNLSLVQHASNDPSGSPWALKENAGLSREYGKGTCPVADGLFERSILLAIPSNLTAGDEDDIIHAFEKVLRALLR
ncbi:MAG: DegT/DnrJ/EryC1/StrS family aminotransferase [Acidobacteria bacterium]|nr:DegT/DnrJ/EryC1/StrS family aminotransferase [Acidobacteriota bacterium]